MTTTLITTLGVAIALATTTASFAAPAGPIHLPIPKMTAARAMKVAVPQLEHRLKGGAFSIISVEWNTPTHFRPHYSDGISWNFANEPNEWSWFITYTVPAEKSETGQEQVHIDVLRIRENGSVEAPVGIRS